MPDFVATIRSPLKNRLEALARARGVSVPALVEEAVERFLRNEEHCEEVSRAFLAHEREKRQRLPDRRELVGT